MKNLAKFKRVQYGDGSDSAPASHFCYACHKRHEIPQHDWILIVREHRHYQELRLICRKSLDEFEVAYGAKL